MSAQGRLKGAVIGLGRMGKQHALCCKDHPQVELKAVCDLQVELAKEVAGECGCGSYSDVGGMLDGQQLDFVVLATPGQAHKQPAMLVAEAGIRGIICESPLATSTQDAREILLAAKSSGTRLLVLYRNRFLPFFRAIKLALETGVLGEAVYADLKLDSGLGTASDVWGEPSPEGSSGSSFASFLMSHTVDLACWWFAPARVERVIGIKQSRKLLGGADLYDSFLLFDSGLKVRVKSEWTRALPDLKELVVTVTGTEGGASCVASAGYSASPGLRFDFHKEGDVQKVVEFKEKLSSWGTNCRLTVGKATPGIAAIEIPAEENQFDSANLLHHYIKALETGKETVGDVPGVGRIPEGPVDGWEQVRVVGAVEESAKKQLPVELGQMAVGRPETSLKAVERSE